jgi:hypothetical protein
MFLSYICNIGIALVCVFNAEPSVPSKQQMSITSKAWLSQALVREASIVHTSRCFYADGGGKYWTKETGVKIASGPTLEHCKEGRGAAGKVVDFN